MVMKNPQVLIGLLFFINPSAFLYAHALQRYFRVNFWGTFRVVSYALFDAI